MLSYLLCTVQIRKKYLFTFQKSGLSGRYTQNSIKPESETHNNAQVQKLNINIQITMEEEVEIESKH